MLPRFYDPTEGCITLDGYDLKDYRIHSLRNIIGFVTQDPILFNDTIYNNIAFGIDDAKPDDVAEAARAANAHDFILEADNGYQTMIGDQGALLSGGQRQRLSIARAILKNPPLMILDEATSALDTSSEKMVQDALQHLMRDRTSLVIAHRLSTIQEADQIVVLDQGNIVEWGTHNRLVQQEGLYHSLYRMQQLEG
jgi:subfamily B ATP-binding cassette protein MsbA